MLGDPRTTFIVVTTLEAAPAHEAGYLVRELTERQYPVGARHRQPGDAAGADVSCRGGERARGSPRPPTGTDLRLDVAGALSRSRRGSGKVDADVVADVLTQVAESFHDVALVATREAERRAELAALAPQVSTSRRCPATSTTSTVCWRSSPACAKRQTEGDGIACGTRPGKHVARP